MRRFFARETELLLLSVAVIAVCLPCSQGALRPAAPTRRANGS
jgi:hypothetical protein